MGNRIRILNREEGSGRVMVRGVITYLALGKYDSGIFILKSLQLRHLFSDILVTVGYVR